MEKSTKRSVIKAATSMLRFLLYYLTSRHMFLQEKHMPAFSFTKNIGSFLPSVVMEAAVFSEIYIEEPIDSTHRYFTQVLSAAKAGILL